MTEELGPATKEVIIEGCTFLIRALGPIDILSLALLDGDIPAVIKFLVEHGTVEPKIEDANDIRADVIMKLAESIQQFTTEHTKQFTPEGLDREDKPPPGMIV